MSQTRRVYSQDELYPPPTPLIYEGEQLNEIAFPLGGIGTGCVSLSGRGALVDWEIFNRPNKDTVLPYTFFTLWAQAEGDEPVTRVVQTPARPPFTGEGGGMYRGFGFGVTREDGSGLPHMRSARFRGEFPFAEIDFEEPDLPVNVRLEAYSPFIPLNADDSGLPIAVLRYHVHNRSDRPVNVSLAGNIYNPIGYPGSGPFIRRRDGDPVGGNVNAFVDEEGVRGLSLTSEKHPPDHPCYGTMALTTTWPEVFHQCAWLRGAWFDAMHDFWDHFSTDGVLPERSYGPSDAGQSDVGTLGLRATLAPGESVVLPFFITWHFPVFVKYWDRHGEGACDCEQATWTNYYASQWDDALDVARYYVRNEERLYGETRLFHRALFDSTLPPYVLDALSSQASILHSPTVLRLPDGTFYGFEGCHSDSGCCEGSCTHVWNYAQTVAFLFPTLERSLRDADYTYNLRDDGHMGFRLQLPLGSPMWEYHAAADGQLGGILKVYRDWLLCGDDAWLHWLWPRLKKALAYAWEQWDPDRDGIIDGVQHNTYDIEFYGPNSMIGSFYLGALRAAEEMARHLGDTEAAEEYARVYASGRERMERELYNGEYYVQKIDVTLAPKYQYGEGCLSDQLIGQWLAHIVGLGHILDEEQVRSAIRAVFEHNWRTDFWKHANPQRIYALNDEQGLLLCTWPRGGRPTLPFVYSDEVWCGIEYQVASHLIYEGYVDEGLSIVKGLRARHDGCRRNPWNEFECGSHYARSMASWAVLTALSGYRFNVPRRALGFAPRLNACDWRSLWSLDSGWGTYSQRLDEKSGEFALHLLRGRLELERLDLGSINGSPRVEITVGDRPLPVSTSSDNGSSEGLSLRFSPAVRLNEGETLHGVLIW
jgi:non-lysosomal glucosylceramidase